MQVLSRNAVCECVQGSDLKKCTDWPTSTWLGLSRIVLHRYYLAHLMAFTFLGMLLAEDKLVLVVMYVGTLRLVLLHFPALVLGSFGLAIFSISLFVLQPLPKGAPCSELPHTHAPGH